MTNLGPNADLIGHPLEDVFTPALIIDLDVFERNLAAMAAYAKAHNIGLRPHAKTHKSVEIARRQIAAGALGVCAATLGEAEALSKGGIADILITTPVIGALKIKRFLNLYAASTGMMVVIDNAVNARELNAAAQTVGLNVDVLVALDIGTHRVGAESPAQALAITEEIVHSAALTFKGIHAYCGNLQHIQNFQERVTKVGQANDILRAFIGKLAAVHIEPVIITGVGTGSHEIDAGGGLFTEMQVGSYVFMDIEYGDIEWSANAFEQALFVATRVVSVNHQGFVTTDGGTKRFSMGSVDPQPVGPRQWSYGFQGDEHGKIMYGDSNVVPGYGDLIQIVPPHCDPTVNLYDQYHVVQEGRLVDIWAIEARGAF